MKILQTPVRCYPYVGGVENYVLSLSKELSMMGYGITIICANEPKRIPEETIDGVKVKRLAYIGKIANTNITLTLPFKLLRENFDIIHTHMPTPWSADWSAIISVIRNKPLIVTYHNDLTGRGINKHIANLYNATMQKILLKMARKIIITNKKYLEYSPHLKKHKNKVVVIPPGVDLKQFKPTGTQKQKNTLFFLSVLDGFHEYKGLDTLLKALAPAKKEIPDIRLVVGGEGSLKEKYRSQAKELGLEENIIFAGFIPQEKIVEYYNQAQAFILPSTSSVQEGFGMVLLEAMACATPVITTEIVGLAEEIKENNAGIIVPPKDTAALSKAITKILTDQQLRNNAEVNARKLATEKYSWEIAAKKTEEIYKSIA